LVENFQKIIMKSRMRERRTYGSVRGDSFRLSTSHKNFLKYWKEVTEKNEK